MPSHTEGSEGLDFIVARENLRQCQFVPGAQSERTELEAGQVLLRVDSFAFTANNVTYAVAGDMMSYWSFFPAPSGWGRVPVWGFADVLRSTHPDIAVGERVFGYLPMSMHLVVQPAHVTRGGFVDAAPHRAALPAVYNQYTRTAGDAGYAAEHEDQQMLLRPLFMTAFLLDDLIADNHCFGARTVVLSSASSKTALSLAFLLHRNRRGQCDVTGLTGAANRAFVESLGCYDRVLTYEQIASLPADVPAVFVDMAGNGAVVSALHHHLRDNMKYSCIVGLTHWERRQGDAELPGAAPTFFFAPTQLQKRSQEWGPDGLQQRYGAAWRQFVEFVTPHLRVVHGRGQAAVERVYLDTLEGRAKPDEGHVLSLWPA